MSKIKAFGEGEWVSEKTKELDKLGGIGGLLTGSFLCLCLVWSCLATICVHSGKNRPPVKRGDSLKMKLQWLQVVQWALLNPNCFFSCEVFTSQLYHIPKVVHYYFQEGLQTTQKIATASLKKDDNNAKWELKQQVGFAHIKLMSTSSCRTTHYHD